MEGTIENLSIQISANASDAAKGVDRLVSTLEKLKSAVNGTNIKSTKNIAKALEPLSKIQNIKISSNLSKRLVDLGAAAELLQGTDFSGFSNLANALKELEGLGNVKLPKIEGGAGATDAAKVLDAGMQKVSESTEKAGHSTRSFSDKLKDTVAPSTQVSAKLKEIASGAKRVGSAMIALPKYFGGKLVSGIKDSVKGIGDFFSKIKSVAMYRLIRTAMNEITQGFSEGIKNLYGWSSAVNGHFAASMDRIATSTQYLKNGLGAMASPLIEAVAPAIDFIIDKFVDMFNIVNQFFARLTGQSTYTAAKKVAATWGDATSDVSSSAKKAANDLKRTILGFDEINKLNDTNTGSGSGGSGSVSGTDYSGMFETRSISGTVSTFADQLKAAFNEANWEALGTLLGNKVNDIVNSVDFAGTGRKVGEAINAWFTTRYWTLDTINFTNIGSKIAEFLNNAIGNIDFATIGASMVQGMTIIGDAAIGFFTDFNWGMAAGKLSDFVKGMFDELTKWLKKYASGDMNWSTIGATIADKLLDIIVNIDYSGLANSMYEALNAAFEAGLGLLSGFFDGLAGRFKTAVNWNALGEGVQTAIEGIMTVVGLGTLAVGAILAFSGVNIPLGIGMMIAGGVATGTALSLQWDGLSNKLKDNIELIKGIVSGATLVLGAVLTFSGANIGLGLGLLVAGAAGLAGTIGANWDVLKQKLQGPIGNIMLLISDALLMLGIVAISAGRIPLGVGLLVAGSTGLASAISARWDRLGSYMEGPLGALTSVLSAASLVLGFVAIAGGRIPLGIGLIISGSTGLASTIAARWDRLNSYLEGPVGDLTAMLSGASLILGFAAIAAGRIPLGLGLMVLGSTGLASTIAARWDRLNSYIEGPLSTLTTAISGALLVLGFAAISAGRIPLGLGMMVAGSAGLATTLAARWNRLHDYIEGPLGTLALLLSGATLVLGFTAIAAGRIPLGVGLIVSGAAGIATNLAARWDRLKEYISGPIGSITVLLSEATLILGFVAIAAGRIPLGLGLIVSGASGLATTLPAQWNILQQKLQGPIGIITGIISGAALLLGILALVGGNIPLGLGLILTGAAGLAETISANWDNIKKLGSDAIAKVKEGWDSVKTFFKLNILPTTENKWLAGFLGINTPSEVQKIIEDDAAALKYAQTVAQSYGIDVTVNGNPGNAMQWSDNGTGALSPNIAGVTSTATINGTAGSFLSGTNTYSLTPNVSDTTASVYTELKKYNWTTIGSFVGTMVDVLTYLGKGNWTTLNGFTGDYVDVLTWLGKGNWTTLGGFVGDFIDVMTYLTNQGTNWRYGLLQWITGNSQGAISIVANLVAGAVTGFKAIFGRAEGGIVTVNGVQDFASGGVITKNAWKRLPKYAGGTSRVHGTMFLAGEAGPEIVGHVGGRTEVLNKSQLAATMYAAVQAAMAPASANFANAAAYMYDGAKDYGEEDMEALMELVRAGSEATQRQNDLLRQQNEYLRQINEKDFSAEISTSGLSHGVNRMNRRAGRTVIPVGT